MSEAVGRLLNEIVPKASPTGAFSCGVVLVLAAVDGISIQPDRDLLESAAARIDGSRIEAIQGNLRELAIQI